MLGTETQAFIDRHVTDPTKRWEAERDLGVLFQAFAEDVRKASLWADKRYRSPRAVALRLMMRLGFYRNRRTS